MKISLLISLLADHLVNYGDIEVIICTKEDYKNKEVKHCWYNFGTDNNMPDRVIISD